MIAVIHVGKPLKRYQHTDKAQLGGLLMLCRQAILSKASRLHSRIRNRRKKLP